MSREVLRFNESAIIHKFNKEDHKLNDSVRLETLKWKCSTKIEKYNTPKSKISGIPDEVQEIKGNTAFITGINLLWNLAIGNGDDSSKYFFSPNNAYIGVGNSSAIALPTQTGLLGTNTAYAPMDQSTGLNYPIINDNTISFRSSFGDNEANFIWNEWGVLNGNPSNPGSRSLDSIVQLDRKVESMGTKIAGSTWVIVVTITITPS